MSTFMAKKGEVERKWYIIDAAGKPLGRTAVQAATIAKEADVRRMCMIHYSPRYTDKELQKLLDEAQAVWPKAELSRDRMHIDIPFID